MNLEEAQTSSSEPRIDTMELPYGVWLGFRFTPELQDTVAEYALERLGIRLTSDQCTQILRKMICSAMESLLAGFGEYLWNGFRAFGNGEPAEECIKEVSSEPHPISPWRETHTLAQSIRR